MAKELPTISYLYPPASTMNNPPQFIINFFDFLSIGSKQSSTHHASSGKAIRPSRLKTKMLLYVNFYIYVKSQCIIKK